jgi:hypothetical protein
MDKQILTILTEAEDIQDVLFKYQNEALFSLVNFENDLQLPDSNGQLPSTLRTKRPEFAELRNKVTSLATLQIQENSPFNYIKQPKSHTSKEILQGKSNEGLSSPMKKPRLKTPGASWRSLKLEIPSVESRVKAEKFTEIIDKIYKRRAAVVYSEIAHAQRLKSSRRRTTTEKINFEYSESDPLNGDSIMRDEFEKPSKTSSNHLLPNILPNCLSPFSPSVLKKGSVRVFTDLKDSKDSHADQSLCRMLAPNPEIDPLNVNDTNVNNKIDDENIDFPLHEPNDCELKNHGFKMVNNVEPNAQYNIGTSLLRAINPIEFYLKKLTRVQPERLDRDDIGTASNSRTTSAKETARMMLRVAKELQTSVELSKSTLKTELDSKNNPLIAFLSGTRSRTLVDIKRDRGDPSIQKTIRLRYKSLTEDQTGKKQNRSEKNAKQFHPQAFLKQPFLAHSSLQQSTQKRRSGHKSNDRPIECNPRAGKCRILKTGHDRPTSKVRDSCIKNSSYK